MLGIILAVQVASIISFLTVFYSLISVALFAPVLAGLYSRRASARGVLWAIGVSVPCTLVLYGSAGAIPLGFLNPFAVGILVSGAVLWVVTALEGR